MNIVNLPIDILINHPDNPRKDFGDLTELAESIKAKGVLQNLTVVPDVRRVDGELVKNYLVVIGNRRRAAAELAGLTELPCVIADMTEKEQYETMMLENLQREDLTVYEQAMGFQTLFDFGDSVETISEKTGFSQSTIRRRLKIAELDKNTLKTVSARPLSLMDFEKLSEIKDLDKRNEVLKHIGTNNFNSQLSFALNTQKEQEQQNQWREILGGYNLKELTGGERYSGKYRYQKGFPYHAKEKDIQVHITDEIKYFSFQYGSVDLYSDKPITEMNEEEDDQEELKREEAKEALDRAFEIAYELRYDFIKDFSKDKAKKCLPAIICALNNKLFRLSRYIYFDGEAYKDLMDFDDSIEENEVLMERSTANPEYALLAYTYSALSDDSDKNCFDWYGKYKKNENLEIIYEFLCSIGYEMSDDEKALMDGSSELYVKDGVDE